MAVSITVPIHRKDAHVYRTPEEVEIVRKSKTRSNGRSRARYLGRMATFRDIKRQNADLHEGTFLPAIASLSFERAAQDAHANAKRAKLLRKAVLHSYSAALVDDGHKIAEQRKEVLIRMLRNDGIEKVKALYEIAMHGILLD